MAARCLMTPDMHREWAAALRARGTPEALRLAVQHEALAQMIEKRLGGSVIAAPPLAPS